MKAIETIHNGYRFRSRLEARWAVFFDSMGIEYDYEKEGFDLGEQGWYLPDFWLPDFKTWVEIKPSNIRKEENHSIEKLETLQSLTGYSVMECAGYPKQLWSILMSYDSKDSSAGNFKGYATFATDYNLDPIILAYDTNSSRIMCNTSEFEALGNILTIKQLIERNNSMRESDDIDMIKTKEFEVFDITETESKSCYSALEARQARFEHNEYQGG